MNKVLPTLNSILAPISHLLIGDLLGEHLHHGAPLNNTGALTVWQLVRLFIFLFSYHLIIRFPGISMSSQKNKPITVALRIVIFFLNTFSAQAILRLLALSYFSTLIYGSRYRKKSNVVDWGRFFCEISTLFCLIIYKKSQFSIIPKKAAAFLFNIRGPPPTSPFDKYILKRRIT